MSFLRFFVFNLLGHALPILIALAAVPTIAHHAGVDRLGALGVVLGLIGYFGFLDFGLSRVVTRRVAIALEQGRIAEELTELRGFLWWWAVPILTAMTLLLIGLRFVLGSFLPAGPLGEEMARSWIWIALCIPVALLTNWLRGALEGEQRFARVNLLRTVFGALNFAIPALVSLVWPTLDAMVGFIVLGRFVGLLAHAWACVQVEPGVLWGHAPRQAGSGKKFFQEGGWITVSNLVAPMMMFADRFVLAAMLPATAVAWYVTSLDVMMRTQMVPVALAGVLFPKFSEATLSVSAASIFHLYQRSIRVISAMMLPLCTAAAVLGYDGLRIWMGDTFAFHSYRVVEIIAIGIFVSSIAQMPFSWLQGVGRSYLTARIHLFELPVYAAGLYFSIKQDGIEGAAWMWTLRVSLDCLLMLALSAKSGRRTALAMAGSGACFILCAGYLIGPERDWQWRVACVAILCAASLLLAWYALLNREDRGEIGRLRHAY
ncbi:MAG: flippase [Burkholderiaceae bacterium]|nr:flippase [Burkholderiaceae bacterium]